MGDRMRIIIETDLNEPDVRDALVEGLPLRVGIQHFQGYEIFSVLLDWASDYEVSVEVIE